jgi:hypothetical protein
VCVNWPECKGKIAYDDEWDESETIANVNKSKRQLLRKRKFTNDAETSKCFIALIVITILVGCITAAITHFVYPDVDTMDMVGDLYSRGAILFPIVLVTGLIIIDSGSDRFSKFVTFLIGFSIAAIFMTFWHEF